MSTPILELQQLQFSWPKQPLIIDIEHFAIAQGETVFLQGPSGSGKTTLLGLLGGVQKAQQGQIKLLGTELSQLSATARDRFRAEHIGFIFQQFNLLPFLTVLKNVTLACRFSKKRGEQATQNGSLEQAASQLLLALGLQQELHHKRADQLSIGQQQRVAAARALLGNPQLIIADEPTSALDSDSRENFLTLLFNQCQQAGSSLLFVSHDTGLARLFDRSVKLDEINKASLGAVHATI